jgi:beta-glucosidase-like glycosyl hydrolase
MNTHQKIAQCFSPAAFIHDTEENYQIIEKLILEQEIGGLTFFHSRHSAAANFEKRAEVLDVGGTLEKMIGLINRYQAISKTPLLISIDGEYGLAMRIEKTPQYPFAITLGAIEENAVELIDAVGFRMGMDMKKAGIHLNLAPCSDVNTNPDNPVIGYRSFGTNPEKVAELSLAMYQGLKKAGIGACLKHFPGHGDTQTDSHLGLPVIQKTKEDLQAIKENNIGGFGTVLLKNITKIKQFIPRKESGIGE